MTERWLTCIEVSQWVSGVFGREVPLRTVQGWCHAHTNPLPHSRLGKRILVRPRDLQAWLQARQVTAQVDQPVGAL